VNLRKRAQGRECRVQLPVCNHNRETVVLAHVKAGWFGMSIKPPDILGVDACSACHDEIDRRTQILEKEFVELETLRAMYRQIVELCKERIIKW